MALDDRRSNLLLGALGALTVASSAFAVWSVQQPHPSVGGGDGADQVSADAGSSTRSADDEALTRRTPGVADSGSSTPSGGEEASSAPVTEEAPAFALKDWTDAWRGGADLLVVGDGYSNLPSQWVQQWAVALSEDRPVTIRHWGEAADRRFNEPIELGAGDGPSLSIWSASRDGSTITDAVERLERFDRASADPEAVLISLGQGSGDEDIPAAMDELLAGLPEVPVLLVVGPADLYDAGVGDALAEWGTDNEERVVTVDLRETTSGSPTAEEWAEAFQEALDG